MCKECEQTNVAEVDNSTEGCDKYTSTRCSIHTEAIAYLELPANSSTYDIIEALVLSLADARQRIKIIEELNENGEQL